MKRILFDIFVVAIFSILFALIVRYAYNLGFSKASESVKNQYEMQIDELVSMIQSGAVSYKVDPISSPTPLPKANTSENASPIPKAWGGPDLWVEVNKRRIQLGVNPLAQKDELCTIASIRLNQLLELGKLDGHQGFSRLPDERSDLNPTFEKYNISEFLLSGAQSALEAVNLWENTLGHKKLLTGGEYVWGCIYAQDTFAVAITAY